MDNKIYYHRWAVLFGLYETIRFNKSAISTQELTSLKDFYHKIIKGK